jgi:hypothetical protein
MKAYTHIRGEPLEDAGLRLRRLRQEAVEAAKMAYMFGDANSYTHEAMRAAVALERELDKFVLTSRRTEQ